MWITCLHILKCRSSPGKLLGKKKDDHPDSSSGLDHDRLLQSFRSAHSEYLDSITKPRKATTGTPPKESSPPGSKELPFELGAYPKVSYRPKIQMK